MTLENRRDSEEQVDPREIETLRAVDREAQDAEYEASTPAAGRWRERLTDTRDDETFNLAQRHRFGRVLDMPPVNHEARGDWLIWLTLGGLVLWAIGAGVLWWLA